MAQIVNFPRKSFYEGQITNRCIAEYKYTVMFYDHALHFTQMFMSEIEM